MFLIPIRPGKMWASKKRDPNLKGYIQSSKVCFVELFDSETASGQAKNKQLLQFLTAYLTRILNIQCNDESGNKTDCYGIVDIRHDENFEAIIHEMLKIFSIPRCLMVKSGGRNCGIYNTDGMLYHADAAWIDEGSTLSILSKCGNCALYFNQSRAWTKIMSEKQAEMFRHPIVK